jgi:serine/threonine-protein kinase RsbW
MDAQGHGAAQGNGRISLELAPLPEFVGTGRMVVASLARHHGFGDEQVEDLRVAVSEAITSAVQSHMDAGIDEAIQVAAWMEGDALTVVVSDLGEGYPEPDVDLTPTRDLAAGLGLTLIRTLVPETTIERRAVGGTSLTMILKREGTA